MNRTGVCVFGSDGDLGADVGSKKWKRKEGKKGEMELEMVRLGERERNKKKGESEFIE